MSIYIDRPEPANNVCVGEQQLVRLGQIGRRLVYTVLSLGKGLNLLKLGLRPDELQEFVVPDDEIGILGILQPSIELVVCGLHIVEGIGCGLSTDLLRDREKRRRTDFSAFPITI